MSERSFVHVALVDRALAHHDAVYTYAVPDGVGAGVGALVRVPVRGRRVTGVVVGELAEPDVPRAAPIAAALGPGLDARTVDLCRWVADRYLSTLGEALAAALPDRVAAEERASVHAPPPTPPSIPSLGLGGYRNGAAIERALERGGGGFVWRPRVDEPRAGTISALVARALAAGGGALVLVPEVRVPGEVARALAGALGDAAAWLGSDHPPRARYRDWLTLRSGAKRVAVGGRAAVFAPVAGLRLVVVDDEGHASYKEGRAPRFQARAVAAERARREGAVLVLVGVPPSVEARAAADGGPYTLVSAPRAAERAARPPVTVVDRTRTDDRLVPAVRTLALAKAALGAGRRVVVLTHRRAGWRTLCERAERIAGAARPARLDARATPEDLAGAAARADLIVATPFLAKDLDLRGVGLLALVEVDAALAQPEFRAAEDAFATWWHAARWAAAGGHVVVETAEPRHAAIAALARWDPDVLYRAEASLRRETGYPPFAALARVDVPAERASEAAATLRAAAPDLEVLGPVERGSGAAVLVVRARRRERLVEALRPVVVRWRAAKEPMRVDPDPREVLVPKWRS